MNKGLKKLLLWAGISGAVALETSVLSEMLERKGLIGQSAGNYLLHEREEEYENKPWAFDLHSVMQEVEEETPVSPIDSFVSGRKVIPLWPAPPVPLGPVYIEKGTKDIAVPKNNCSRYTHHAARDLFGLNYPECDAWDIRNYSSVGKIRLNEKIALERLADEEKLRHGMIVGLFYPKSGYNNRLGAKIAGYTHVLLYTGKENGALFGADKFGKETRQKVAIRDAIKRNNLTPIEVLYLK